MLKLSYKYILLKMPAPLNQTNYSFFLVNYMFQKKTARKASITLLRTASQTYLFIVKTTYLPPFTSPS